VASSNDLLVRRGETDDYAVDRFGGPRETQLDDRRLAPAAATSA
jgi:broad specificity phosphatase PhoE